jgi:hypothetical protein
MATGWTFGVLGFDSLRGLRIFLFTTASRTALRPTQPPIQWVPGVLSMGLKRSGREADHSPPSSAEVKEWVELYLYLPQFAFMAWCSVKAQGQLYFILISISSWNCEVQDQCYWKTKLVVEEGDLGGSRNLHGKMGTAFNTSVRKLERKRIWNT